MVFPNNRPFTSTNQLQEGASCSEICSLFWWWRWWWSWPSSRYPTCPPSTVKCLVLSNPILWSTLTHHPSLPIIQLTKINNQIIALAQHAQPTAYWENIETNELIFMLSLCTHIGIQQRRRSMAWSTQPPWLIQTQKILKPKKKKFQKLQHQQYW